MPDTEPSLREATPDDLPAICGLGEAVNALHHEAWPQVFAEPGDPLRHAAHWRQSIATEQATVFVVERAGQVIGFVTVGLQQDNHLLLQPTRYARIGSISVAPDCQGQGLGRRLMQAAEAWARQRGAPDIRLNVWAFNQRALALYEELGYEVRSQVLGKRLG